jgi:anthranilate synthase/aminodeoxychorismate synthase-like glutamine amidotransferase
MRLVLVDAYDSFTHNLAQGFAVLGAQVEVVRCDAISAEELLARGPDLCVFGPGPGRPEDAGCFLPAIRALCGRVPLLGVCLGHQALAMAFGGSLLVHPPVHGHATPVHHDGTGVFGSVPPGAPMGRYHSLGIDPSTLPSALRINAWSSDGVVMGVTHRQALAWGVQFHPESVMSGEAGMQILRNFVELPRAVRISSTGWP